MLFLSLRPGWLISLVYYTWRESIMKLWISLINFTVYDNHLWIILPSLIPTLTGNVVHSMLLALYWVIFWSVIHWNCVYTLVVVIFICLFLFWCLFFVLAFMKLLRGIPIFKRIIQIEHCCCFCFKPFPDIILNKCISELDPLVCHHEDITVCSI